MTSVGARPRSAQPAASLRALFDRLDRQFTELQRQLERTAVGFGELKVEQAEIRGLGSGAQRAEARYVRLVASVLVVLDCTFDDAEELREFSLRYLAGFANFGKPLADAECGHHSLEGEHVHALSRRERG